MILSVCAFSFPLFTVSQVAQVQSIFRSAAAQFTPGRFLRESNPYKIHAACAARSNLFSPSKLDGRQRVNITISEIVIPYADSFRPSLLRETGHHRCECRRPDEPVQVQPGGPDLVHGALPCKQRLAVQSKRINDPNTPGGAPVSRRLPTKARTWARMPGSILTRPALASAVTTNKGSPALSLTQ